MNFPYSIEPIAECSVMIQFDAQPSPELSSYIGQMSASLSLTLQQWIMNITPSYTTILIDYLPHRISVFDFFPLLEHVLDQPLTDLSLQPNSIRLPVYYDKSVAPELTRFEKLGMNLEAVISLHTNKEYTVSAIGFAPGFAFMTNIDEKLRLPRLTTPRTLVPKGSVAIAENQTAIYPNQSPGGWNIIGNCPISLYSSADTPMTPFSIGTKVTFYSIDRVTFLDLGGTLEFKGQ